VDEDMSGKNKKVSTVFIHHRTKQMLSMRLCG